MWCPACGECGFEGGRCAERVSRGRRFFLMGALALPVARKIEVVAGIIAPAAPVIGPESLLIDMRVVMAIQDLVLKQVFRDSLFPAFITRVTPQDLEARFG